MERTPRLQSPPLHLRPCIGTFLFVTLTSTLLWQPTARATPEPTPQQKRDLENPLARREPTTDEIDKARLPTRVWQVGLTLVDAEENQGFLGFEVEFGRMGYIAWGRESQHEPVLSFHAQVLDANFLVFRKPKGEPQANKNKPRPFGSSLVRAAILGTRLDHTWIGVEVGVSLLGREEERSTLNSRFHLLYPRASLRLGKPDDKMLVFHIEQHAPLVFAGDERTTRARDNWEWGLQATTHIHGHFFLHSGFRARKIESTVEKWKIRDQFVKFGVMYAPVFAWGQKAGSFFLGLGYRNVNHEEHWRQTSPQPTRQDVLLVFETSLGGGGYLSW